MKISLLTLLKLYLPMIGFMIVTAWIGQLVGFTMFELVSDPAEISGQSAFIGFFSQIGNLLWCATAAICFFSASIIRAGGSKPADSQTVAFLIFSGLLSAQFLLDDQFRLHERFSRVLYGPDAVVPRAVQNLTELLVFMVYALVFVAFVTVFRKLILRSQPVFLCLAVAFLGLSTIVDQTPETMFSHYELEEGCKLLGIFSWLMYFCQFSAHKIQMVFAPTPTNALLD